MSDRIYNFSAGPATLPEPVLKQAQRDLWNIADSGIGIAEHSHRGAVFSKIIEETEANCRKLAGIPDRYKVLFLPGGASTQFFMIPMNLLSEGRTADYINTGAWSKKAIAEAEKLGNTHIAGTSEDANFNYVPKQDQLSFSNDPAYVHFTSNNTIFGTQWSTEPNQPGAAPLICDSSSDIFSRPFDIAKYGMIYAGSQKNLGPAGVTLVIIRDDLVAAGPVTLPTMLQYRTHADKGSLYNTPPVLPIYMLGEVVKWILDFGGLGAMAEYNRDKAAILYDYLGNTDFFRTTAEPDSRSLMNVTFRGPSAELDKKFLAEAGAGGFSGLKGHRSVGGMRASIYNAFPRAGCEKLVGFLGEFESANR